MMKNFKSGSLFLKVDFILPVKGGKFLPEQSIGTLRAECTVNSSILIAATQVGGMSDTFVFLTDLFRDDKVLIKG